MAAPDGAPLALGAAETEPGITQVTETFDYTTARTPRLLEILGQPGKNAIGITKTLQALQARFG